MRLSFVVLLLLGAIVAGPATAGDKEIAAIETVLSGKPIDTGMFAASFLAQVSPAQLTAVVAQVVGGIGPVTAVTPQTGATYLVETDTYEMPVDVVLDGDGKISGLFLHPPTKKNASLDELLKDMATAAPQTGYLITRNGAVLASSHPDLPLAVGSAFKLGILKALKDEIDAGARKWSDVVTLSAGNISLPTGQLQDWPVGTAVTLDTLAALMISISDNTAADTLLHVVGRDKVEAVLGIAPVLTTRDLFTLKAAPDLTAKYKAGDLATKRAVLDEIDKLPLPDVSKVTTLFDANVEWTMPAQKLCDLIGSVADLKVTQINAGAASPADWTRISFKGGSELGVLSAATWLVGKDGATYCAAAIWNGPAALDDGKTIAAYTAVLHRLAKG